MRNAKAWLIAAALAAALAGCDSVEERVDKHYARGMELLAEGTPEKAVLEFRNALQLNGDHAPSRFEIARLYEADGELRAALSNYRLTTELDPTNAAAHVKVGQFLITGGDVEGAAGFIDKAIALTPDDPDALAALGALELRRDNASAAVAAAQKALRADPNHLNATVVLASERMRAGDVKAALERIDAMLAKAPRDRALNVLKMQVLEQSGDAEAAEAQLRVLIDLLPEEIDLRRSLAARLVARGAGDEAVEEMRAISRAEPENVSAALDVVRLLRQLQGEEAARNELTMRIANAPGSAEAFPFIAELAALDIAAGQPEAARAALSEVAENASDPDTARQAQLRLAQLDMAAGDVEAARARVDAVIAGDEANVEALALRGAMLIDADRAEEAIRDLRSAMDADPENTRLMLLAARAYQRAGNTELAGERLATAARASGFAPEIVTPYARFLREQGRAEAAESLLTESFRRFPQDRSVLAQLASLRLRLGDWAGAEEVAGVIRKIDATAADQVMAAALAGRGDLGDGLEILEDAAASPEAGRGVLTALIQGYMRAGRVADAEARLDAALAENPQDVQALLLRAEVHNARGEVAQSETLLQAVVEAAPSSAEGYAGLARLRGLRGDGAGMEEILRDGLEKTNGAPALRLALAGLLETQNDFDGAIAEYEALYAQNPDSVVVANNLTSLLAEHRADDPEALARAGNVAQRLRGLAAPEFQDTYGWVLFLQGDLEGALRILAPAAEALPNNPFVRYHAGRAFAALGQTEQARQHLEAALALAPNFAKAQSAQATLAALPAPAPGQ